MAVMQQGGQERHQGGVLCISCLRLCICLCVFVCVVREWLLSTQLFDINRALQQSGCGGLADGLIAQPAALSSC